MSRLAKFFILATIICIVLVVTCVALSTLISSWILRPIIEGFVEPGLGGLFIGVFVLIPLAAIAVIIGYYLSYFIAMRYARKQNAETSVITHPRRSFALAALFSLILLTWGLTLSSYLSSSNSSNPPNPSTPTPTPSITPEPVEEGMIMRNTMPVPPPAKGSTSSDREVAGATTSEEVAMVRTAVSQINHALIAQDSQVLYANLSSQLTAMFSAESVAEAFTSLSSASIEMVGDPKISDQWATQKVSYTNNGAAKTYTIVLHLENGSWKFLGTINQ